MVHSYFGNKPELTVFDSQIAAGDNGNGKSAVFNAAENTLTTKEVLQFNATPPPAFSPDPSFAPIRTPSGSHPASDAK